MTSPRTLLKAWGFHPRKSMGQNFLTDPQVVHAILEGAHIDGKDAVLEIGSGLGALTLPVAYRARKVYAVEPDRRIAKLLKTDLLANGLGNVQVIEQDILTCDIAAITEPTDRPLKVIGNLPYHISSQVVVFLVTHRRYTSHAVLMFQKEVAQRLLAKPGTKAYGRLSVLLGYTGRSKALLDVPASAFYPQPGVDSTVVAIDFFETLPFAAIDESLLFALVQAGFGQRRKMLRNALKRANLGLESADLRESLERAGIDDKRRAETLSVEEFVNLANVLTKIQPKI